MVTSEKLAARTYPGIQELHSKLKKLIDSLCVSPISHPSGRVFFSSRSRNEIYTRPLDSLCSVVEKLLTQEDSQYELSADARTALSTALSNAHHFAAVIFFYFYNSHTLRLLFDTKQHIDDAYAQYGHILNTS